MVKKLGLAAFVHGQKGSGPIGKKIRGYFFVFHEVGIEPGRPSHRLGRIVDEDIKALVVGFNVGGKDFNARGVAKIKPEDLEAVAPLGKILFT